jgi:hypothetical protein
VPTVDEGDWIIVTKRKRHVGLTTPPMVAQSFHPYSPHNYAQVLTSPSPPKLVTAFPVSQSMSKPTTQLDHISTTKILPTSQSMLKQTTTTFTSPYSSTTLHFPPSPYYHEWRGRCFHGARFSHVIADCRFPRKCLSCWQDGHNSNECCKLITSKGKEPMLSATALPFTPRKEVPHLSKRIELGFDELLKHPVPSIDMIMPYHRPNNLKHFVSCRVQHIEEIKKLKSIFMVPTRRL